MGGAVHVCVCWGVGGVEPGTGQAGGMRAAQAGRRYFMRGALRVRSRHKNRAEAWKREWGGQEV